MMELNGTVGCPLRVSMCFPISSMVRPGFFYCGSIRQVRERVPWRVLVGACVTNRLLLLHPIGPRCVKLPGSDAWPSSRLRQYTGFVQDIPPPMCCPASRIRPHPQTTPLGASRHIRIRFQSSGGKRDGARGRRRGSRGSDMWPSTLAMRTADGRGSTGVRV